MIASDIQIEFRRRLPSAPKLPDGDLNGVSSEVHRRGSMELLHSKTMEVLPKKRLTPEVVATLLSMDFPCDGSGPTPHRNNVVRDDTRAKSRTEMKTPRECAALSNCKDSSQDNIGIVEIVKKSGQLLGFSLRECNGSNSEKKDGIFVSRLTAGGVVEQYSLFCAGDEILEINYVPVKGYKLSDVVAMIQIPKRLVLKVKFRQNPHQNSAMIQAELNEKPRLRINNNYIDDNISKAAIPCECVNNKRTCATEGRSQLEQGKKGNNSDCVPTPDAISLRRMSDSSTRSSGRILPAPPELETVPNSLENKASLGPSKPHPFTASNDPQRTEPNDVQDTNRTFLNGNSGSPTLSPTKLKNRKKSAVLPLSTTEGKKQSREEGKHNKSKETRNEVCTKRVDPGDIRFDLVTNNGSSTDVSKSSPTQEEEVERNRDFIPTSLPLGLRKNSRHETFGSSSSLSSSDSPQTNHRRKISVNSPGKVSSPGMRLRSSWPTDGSPVSSSAESEDPISKNTSSNKINHNTQLKPLFLSDSLLSDELNQSQSSWFSKIGNQKRKRTCKFSECVQLQAPRGGEAYRIQESNDLSKDGIDPGYRLYFGRNESAVSPRAVTGMLVLHIVKIRRILPAETISKDKLKKIKIFCTVDADGIRQACTVSKKGLDNIQWNESFEIVFQRTREMKITLWIHSKKAGNETLSESCLCLAQLLSEGNEHNLAVGLEQFGILYVKLQFTDMKLLLQRTPSQKKEGIFGFPLESVLRRENSRIPTIVKKCVEEINRRGLEVTGIYRLCGNAARKRALRAQFENSSANMDLGQTENPVDVNVITGLLKDYLRELPDPPLSEEVRKILYEASATEMRSESKDQFLVDQIIRKFSATSRDTVVYLLDHFAMVLMNSDVNKMDGHNLAVCIGPVLLCPSLGTSSNNLVGDTKKDINAIKLLLEIWPKPEQVSAC